MREIVEAQARRRAKALKESQQVNEVAKAIEVDTKGSENEVSLIRVTPVTSDLSSEHKSFKKVGKTYPDGGMDIEFDGGSVFTHKKVLVHILKAIKANDTITVAFGHKQSKDSSPSWEKNYVIFDKEDLSKLK